MLAGGPWCDLLEAVVLRDRQIGSSAADLVGDETRSSVGGRLCRYVATTIGGWAGPVLTPSEVPEDGPADTIYYDSGLRPDPVGQAAPIVDAVLAVGVEAPDDAVIAGFNADSSQLDLRA